MARGLLRLILSYYLGIEPVRLRFSYGRHGKPSLAILSSQDRLTFNLSRCGGRALLAVSRNREVGIDLEQIRTDFPCRQIAQQFFSSRENAMLQSLRTEQARRTAFFVAWARKEAYVKARGDGLALPLSRLTCLSCRESRRNYWACEEIRSKRRAGHCRTSTPAAAMSPPLPWKDTAGISPTETIMSMRRQSVEVACLISATRAGTFF